MTSVKKLEWREDDIEDDYTAWVADVPFGSYHIGFDDGEWFAFSDDGTLDAVVGSEQEGKEACQVHFSTLVMRCLDE